MSVAPRSALSGLALNTSIPWMQAILSQFSRTRQSKKKSKTARTAFDAVLADLDTPEDALAEFEAELGLVPEGSEDGDQTDEARDEADDLLLDEIEDAESGTVKPSKEDILMGKQALEKVSSLARYMYDYTTKRSV